MFTDDPQRQAMMMLAAGLLSPVNQKGWGGFGQALGRGIQGGLLGYNDARANIDRRAEFDMRRKFQERELEAMDKAASDRDFMAKTAGQFFRPGNAPSDGMGPVAPPQFDPAGFGMALAQRGMVREAMPFIPKPEGPKAPIKMGKDDRLIDPVTNKEIVGPVPGKPEADFKDYPSGGRIVRVFKDGTSRVLYSAPEPKAASMEAQAPKPTPAQSAVDKAYAKDYLEWTQGGKADAEKSIGQLRDVSDRLGKSDSISGGLVGNIPHSVRSTMGMESADVQDQVEEIVQRNLRLILGAQFTEKEGARLIARAYNPRLDEKTNKARVDRLLKQIDEAAKAKQSQADYYEKNGTLVGWDGKVWTMADFDPDGAKERKSSGKVSGGWSIQRVD